MVYNIFVRRGLAGVKKAAGYAADYNVFLEGARRVLSAMHTASLIPPRPASVAKRVPWRFHRLPCQSSRTGREGTVGG